MLSLPAAQDWQRPGRHGEYPKAEEYYEKAMKQVEEIRSGLLPPESDELLYVKKGGFARFRTSEGLSRVRIKLNHPDASIAPSELTKARSFADHLSQTNANGANQYSFQPEGKRNNLTSINRPPQKRFR